jgi:hypothetical protein
MMLLTPAAARANDGGWLDWLYRLDAKLWGVNTEFHVLCLDAQGKRQKPCEEWFQIPRLFRHQQELVNLDQQQIKHELNVRVGVYSSYGKLTTSNSLKQLIKLDNGIRATKLQMTYTYRADPHIDVGLGAGIIHFRGDDLDGSHASAILTPLSVSYTPARSGPWWKRTFYVRGEASYLMRTVTSDVFKGGAAGEHAGEWNVSFGSGFDLRRRPSGVGAQHR